MITLKIRYLLDKVVNPSTEEGNIIFAVLLIAFTTFELTGFFIDNGIAKRSTFEGKAYIITHTMEQL